MGVDEIHEVDVFLVADIEAVHRDMVVEVSVELVKERVAISIGIFAEVIPRVVFHLQLLNKEPSELVRILYRRYVIVPVVGHDYFLGDYLLFQDASSPINLY